MGVLKPPVNLLNRVNREELERNNGPGGHEGHEGLEERLSSMLGIELCINQK